MSDIFISYKREDKAKAEILVQLLEKKGWSVWWDLEILGGKNFRDVIDQELDAAKCVLVLWSKLSVKADYVLDEATKGKKQDKLIPVLIDQVGIPSGFGN